MQFTPEASRYLLSRVADIMQTDEPDVPKLERLWHSMMFIRATIAASAFSSVMGSSVLSGPFKGMRLTPEAMNGIFGPLLTGCYEQELHPAIERAIATPYRHILNIGCAWGYYSVGLALRKPQAMIHAFDTEEKEQIRCHAMAELNGVNNRIQIGGLFKGEDFATYADEKTFLITDIEGAETALLNPELYPALRKMDMIVELHDLIDPSISETLRQRFAATHDITIIQNHQEMFDFTPFLSESQRIDPVDRFLINWENRGGSTPWAVMWAR